MAFVYEQKLFRRAAKHRVGVSSLKDALWGKWETVKKPCSMEHGNTCIVVVAENGISKQFPKAGLYKISKVLEFPELGALK